MQPNKLAKKVIYWADDDVDDLELFTEVLNEVAPDYELHQFYNGKELIEHLKGLEVESLPGLIILDMNMPVMDGRETIKSLTQDTRFDTIPRVIFTTSESPLDKLFCNWMHTEMLTKPVTKEAIRKALIKMLSYYALQEDKTA